MPDGRMAQFIILGGMIDQQPDFVSGAMANMIVMLARPAKSGQQGEGVHYVVWHPGLPYVPPFDPTVTDPITQFPWIDVTILSDPATPNRFSYEWKDVKTGRKLFAGGFSVIAPVPPPDEPANANTAH